jgi:hypothetical protein
MCRITVFSLTLALTACATPLPKPPAQPATPSSASTLSAKLAAPELFAPLDTSVQKTAVEHERLRRLLVNLERIEEAPHTDLAELTGSGQHNLDQQLNFNSIEEIDAARQRARIFGAQLNRFSAEIENSWAQIAEKVRNNDLDEPLATELNEKLSVDQSNIYPNYRAWIRAAREVVEAVTRYCDFYEHNWGQFKLTENSLTFTDPKVAAALSKVQTRLIAAEEHYRYAAHAALENCGNTIQFVASAMREMEKGMTKREGANVQADSEKK